MKDRDESVEQIRWVNERFPSYTTTKLLAAYDEMK